jgi:hypothetical protein
MVAVQELDMENILADFVGDEISTTGETITITNEDIPAQKLSELEQKLEQTTRVGTQFTVDMSGLMPSSYQIQGSLLRMANRYPKRIIVKGMNNDLVGLREIKNIIVIDPK